MKPINIYALTRVTNPSSLQRLERQMSKRGRCLKIKEWEIQGIRALSEHLNEVVDDSDALCFYYSFVMPKLGKEFDLLRVSEDAVVNIELKSGGVSDETIKKQLLQNRYYLATLGKTIHSYTFVSNQNRLVRLSNSNRLVDTDWQELAGVLSRQKDCYTGPIEELFKEDKYLISPLTDPGRFLRQEYFLTSQQNDIKRQILKNIRQGGPVFQGFTGLPGTGKTILLYDIAMQLSWKEKVCIFHYGSHAEELEHLDSRLKRIDFYYCEAGERIAVREKYVAIFVDEGHRISKEALDDILGYAREWEVPVIFSYDCEDAISPYERKQDGTFLIEGIPNYIRYHLTNRIRVNSELSSFIRCVMHVIKGNHRPDYPSVSLAYANYDKEAEILLRSYESDGYIYIRDELLKHVEVNTGREMEAAAATCKEFDKVVMLIDDSFYYDEEGYLRFRTPGQVEDARVRNLFHGLSRAKEGVAIVVWNNEAVFETLLSIVQKKIT